MHFTTSAHRFMFSKCTYKHIHSSSISRHQHHVLWKSLQWIWTSQTDCVTCFLTFNKAYYLVVYSTPFAQLSKPEIFLVWLFFFLHLGLTPFFHLPIQPACILSRVQVIGSSFCQNSQPKIKTMLFQCSQACAHFPLRPDLTILPNRALLPPVTITPSCCFF